MPENHGKTFQIAFYKRLIRAHQKDSGVSPEHDFGKHPQQLCSRFPKKMRWQIGNRTLILQTNALSQSPNNCATFPDAQSPYNVTDFKSDMKGVDIFSTTVLARLEGKRGNLVHII